MPNFISLTRPSLTWPLLQPISSSSLLYRNSLRQLSNTSPPPITPPPLSSTEPLPVRPRTSSLPPPVPLHLQEAPTHRLVAAALVSRLPLLLPPLTPFERAYYAYQLRLARALERPLQPSFFFRPGSQAERAYLEERAAEDSAKVALKQEDRASDPADEDERSLERRKDRTVYLFVKKEKPQARWQLPQGGLGVREGLVEGAVRELHEELGPDMDIWSIGHVPAAYYTYSGLPAELAESGLKGTKVWIMPQRILRGRPQISEMGKQEGIIDFAWLAQDEIEGRVSEELWDALRPITSTP
ncbi:hypothetical protein CROQUDRAFT_715021 [Cronartium quercuum f. sp. fusiforme G11]|uniref:Large ribosomal subunit protein mL46 n=1 Tax=Cronartium quercuum f. sp. fusiforme G11 TaxID=708437 RepID=A0A9P6TEC3_9BASI|nr:hypothetical protein CROQUDRAFT_715021 [Cronartium quercuum f. sp. fusiforme G11]